MKKMMEKIWKKEEGFTLIELIIVIAILAIISAIAIPNILGAVDKSRKASDESNASKIAQAIAMSRVESDAYSNETGLINITSASHGSGITDGFVDEILKQMNNDQPAPAFKSIHATHKAAEFIAYVDGDGVITVFSASGGVATSATTISAVSAVVEVYPNADGIYD